MFLFNSSWRVCSVMKLVTPIKIEYDCVVSNMYWPNLKRLKSIYKYIFYTTIQNLTKHFGPWESHGYNIKATIQLCFNKLWQFHDK